MNQFTQVPQSASGMKNGLTNSNPLNAGEVDNPHNGTDHALGDESPRFSLFRRPVRNAYPCKVINLLEAYELITNGSYQSEVKALRAITDKSEAAAFKKNNFDFLTFSGIFNYRNSASLVKHSGLLTFDFDDIDLPERLKERLLNDNLFEIVLMFTSPSGHGLKCIMAIDLQQATHLEWFETVAQLIKKSYQLDIDPSGKDTCRACFLSYDPMAYINEAYLPKTISNIKF